MTHTNQPTGSEPMMSRQRWRRLQRIYLSTIFLLTAIILISIYIILLQDGAFGLIPKFCEPISREEVKKYIKKHRNTLVFRQQTAVITYDTGTIGRYLRDIYPKEIERRNNTDTNYIWQVGFYPMHRYDEYGERRLDFAIIPTLVEKHGRHIKDFYADDDTTVDKLRPTSPVCFRPDTACNDCLGYDAGNIWP